jgi:hypothetical protein
VGPRAVLDAVVKRKIHSPRQESNPRTPVVQPNIKMDLREIRWEGVDWMYLAEEGTLGELL